MKEAPRDRPSARGLRIAIVRSLFNRPVTDGLLAGALSALAEMGAAPGSVSVFDLPGAFELPLGARAAARSGRHDAVVALGAVIEGRPITTSTWPARPPPASPPSPGRPACRWPSAS
jgi:6,7-dimethyl-8-ribityllumazine synthase